MLLLLTLSSLVRLSRGYSTGAPADVCTTFLPGQFSAAKTILTFNFLPSGHGSEPRDVSELPYKVQLSSQSVLSGEKVTVSLTGSGFLTSPELKGFLMQVCRSAVCRVRLAVLTIHHSSVTCSHINKTICNLRLFLLCLIVS